MLPLFKTGHISASDLSNCEGSVKYPPAGAGGQTALAPAPGFQAFRPASTYSVVRPAVRLPLREPLLNAGLPLIQLLPLIVRQAGIHLSLRLAADRQHLSV